QGRLHAARLQGATDPCAAPGVGSPAGRALDGSASCATHPAVGSGPERPPVPGGPSYFAMSFSDLSGRTLITRRAGFALNTCSIFVNGLIPLRALVAGFSTTVIFIRPGTVNTPAPFLPTARPISVDSASSTPETCLRVSFVPSAMLLMISLLVGALPFATSDLLVGRRGVAHAVSWSAARTRYHRITVFTAFRSTILKKRLR